MKKIICVFLGITVIILTSCSNHKNVKIETRTDSINYAFGASQGHLMIQQIIGDASNTNGIKQFCKGLKKTFIDSLDNKEKLQIEGYIMGYAIAQQTKNGFFFGDSTLIVKKDLFLKVFKKTLFGEEWDMTPEEGEMYFNKLILPSMQKGENANFTEIQIDSVNMIFGLINGTGARQAYLKEDNSSKAAKTFYKHFSKGIESKDNNELYNKGVEIGFQFRNMLKTEKYLFNDSSIEINFGAIKRGLIEALEQDKKAVMSVDEANSYLQNYYQIVEAARKKKYSAEGEAFLAENAKKDSILVTESGLQYKIEKLGNGEKPNAIDTVKVHYEGTLIDGTVFDSSIQRGEPIEFPLNQVISGWTEGLQLMPIGSKFTFYIPYQLAYGEHGAGQMIPPYSALIFKVELIDIKKNETK